MPASSLAPPTYLLWGDRSEADLPQVTQLEQSKARGLPPKLETKAPRTRVVGWGGNSSPIKESLSKPANQRALDRRRSLPIRGTPTRSGGNVGILTRGGRCALMSGERVEAAFAAEHPVS